MTLVLEIVIVLFLFCTSFISIFAEEKRILGSLGALSIAFAEETADGLAVKQKKRTTV